MLRQALTNAVCISCISSLRRTWPPQNRRIIVHPSSAHELLLLFPFFWYAQICEHLPHLDLFFLFLVFGAFLFMGFATPSIHPCAVRVIFIPSSDQMTTSDLGVVFGWLPLFFTVHHHIPPIGILGECWSWSFLWQMASPLLWCSGWMLLVSHGFTISYISAAPKSTWSRLEPGALL